MADNHIIIVGGISVNDKNDHDKYPYNFINPAVRRAKALIAAKGSVQMIMYTPSYETRVKNQKEEHSIVENPKKDPEHFVKTVEAAAKKQGFTLHKIKSAAELTDKLKGFNDIATIDFFGHSNDKAMFLEYGSVTPEKSTDFWSKADAASIKPTQFTKSAVFASYGCYQGDPGGLAESLRESWRIRTIGSKDKTDFENTGRGATFPKSKKGYYEYPAPAVDKKGDLVRPLPPAKQLTHSDSSPPK
jgi:hypothetical protein